MSTTISITEQPPDEVREEIKVMILQPAADPASEIICNLHTITLNDNHPQPYEALSYAWEGNMVTILLDNAPVKVSQNLKSALIQMRYTDRPRYLWIDATSITQTPEGIMQGVPRILDAFKKAERVLIWLGPEEDNSRLAMDHLASLAAEQLRIDAGSVWAMPRSILVFTITLICSLFRFCLLFLLGILWNTYGFAAILPLFIWYFDLWRHRYICGIFFFNLARPFGRVLMNSAWFSLLSWLWTAIPRPKVKFNPEPQTISSLCRLFERRWFTRTWIIQEVVAAKESVVICGSRQLPWSALVDAVDRINAIAMSETGRSPYLDCMYKRVSSITTVTELDEMPPSVMRQRQSLLYLATTFSTYDATAPQDKINGMLGLSSDKAVQFAHGDKSVVEVFTQTTESIITTSGNLDVLRACLHKGTVQGLPSWVPDWTAKDLRSVSGLAYRRDPWFLDSDGAPLDKQPMATFSSDLHQMVLQGVVVAKLKSQDSVFSYSLNGGFIQLSEEHASAIKWLTGDKIPDGKIPLSSTSWTAPIAIILGRSVRYYGILLSFLSYIPGFYPLLTKAVESNWWGFGFFFNVLKEGLSKQSNSGRWSRSGVWPCSWEALAMALNPENHGSTFQSGWDTITMRKGLEVDSSKSRFSILSTYAEDAKVGDLVVCFMGAKVPFMIRPVDQPGEMCRSESISSAELQKFHLIGPASWGGFAGDTVFWNETKEAYAKGEHMLEQFTLV